MDDSTWNDPCSSTNGKVPPQFSLVIGTWTLLISIRFCDSYCLPPGLRPYAVRVVLFQEMQLQGDQMLAVLGVLGREDLEHLARKHQLGVGGRSTGGVAGQEQVAPPGVKGFDCLLRRFGRRFVGVGGCHTSYAILRYMQFCDVTAQVIFNSKTIRNLRHSFDGARWLRSACR